MIPILLININKLCFKKKESKDSCDQNYLFDIENSIYNDEDAYLNILKSIEYDIFSGKKYLYNYISKPIATNLKFGSKDIILSNIYIEKGKLIAGG